MISSWCLAKSRSTIQGNGVEGKIPCGIPGIFPFVGHGNHVVVEHVIPLLVSHPAWPARADIVFPQPELEIEEVMLLAPQHAGERLAHDHAPVGVEPAGHRGVVKLIGFLRSRPQSVAKVGPGQSRMRMTSLPPATTSSLY